MIQQCKMERAKQDQRVDKYWKQEERKGEAMKRTRSKLRLQVNHLPGCLLSEEQDVAAVDDTARQHIVNAMIRCTSQLAPFARCRPRRFLICAMIDTGFDSPHNAFLEGSALH